MLAATTSTQQFDWVRMDSVERAYELCAGHQKLISLMWQNLQASRATAEAPTDCWMYSCVGYFSKQVVIKCLTTDETIATFVPGTRGGTLRFTDNRTYTLKSAYPKHPEMYWEDENGECLIHFKGVFAVDGKSGSVELADSLAGCVDCENPLLISLGWYLMVTSYLDMTLIL